MMIFNIVLDGLEVTRRIGILLVFCDVIGGIICCCWDIGAEFSCCETSLLRDSIDFCTWALTIFTYKRRNNFPTAKICVGDTKFGPHCNQPW